MHWRRFHKRERDDLVDPARTWFRTRCWSALHPASTPWWPTAPPPPGLTWTSPPRSCADSPSWWPPAAQNVHNAPAYLLRDVTNNATFGFSDTERVLKQFSGAIKLGRDCFKEESMLHRPRHPDFYFFNMDHALTTQLNSVFDYRSCLVNTHLFQCLQAKAKITLQSHRRCYSTVFTGWAALPMMSKTNFLCKIKTVPPWKIISWSWCISHIWG